MAKVGDLKDLLGIIDTPDRLKWLEVDGVDYRENEEVLPKQNLQTIPDLEAAWSFVGELSPYNLSADNVDRATPFWEDITPIKVSDVEMQETLLTYLRQNLSKGLNEEMIRAQMEQSFSADVLAKNSNKIASVFKAEAGLLGVVYTDARLFPRCASGVGKKEVRASVPYVLAKSACSSCTQNQNGQCATFGKDLTFEPEYDEDLWDQIAPSQFISLEDKFATLQKIPVKKRIQAASKLVQKRPTFVRSEIDSKPLMPKLGKMSAEEEKKALLSAQGTRTILRDIQADRKREVLASYMMSQGTDEKVKILIASDKDLAPLKPHMHVLGSLYLDMSFFKTWEDARNWTSKNASIVEKIPFLVGTPYGESGASIRNASRDQMQWDSKDVQGSIVARYRLASGSGVKVSKLNALSKSLASMTPAQVRKVAQGLYAKPISEKAKKYSNLGMMTYHVKTGMTLGQAKKHLSLQTTKSYSTDGGKAQAQRIQVAKVLATGNYEGRVLEVIASHPHLAPLKDHVYGHGMYYLDRNLFASDADLKSFLKKHSSKASLPVVQGGNPYDVPEVRSLVLRSMQASGAKVATLEGVDSTSVRKLAYASARRGAAVAEYDATAQKRKEVKVTAAEASEALGRLRASVPKNATFDAAAHKGEGWVKHTAALSRGSEKDQLRYLLAHKVSVKDSTILPDSKVYAYHSVRKMAKAWAKGNPMRQHLATLRPVDILSHAPIIAAFRNEEGLYGRAYMVADVFEDCKEGARLARPTVNQIVRASKCSECVYRKESSCSLYQADLVDTPSYTKQEAMKHVGMALKEGRISKASFQSLLTDLTSGRKTERDVIRRANLANAPEQSKEAFSGEENVSYFGSGSARNAFQADPDRVISAATVMIDKGFLRSEVVSRLQASFDPRDVKAAIKQGLPALLKKASTTPDLLGSMSASSNGLDQMQDMDMESVQNNIDMEFTMHNKGKGS